MVTAAKTEAVPEAKAQAKNLAKAQAKTQATTVPVAQFIAAVDGEQRRADCEALVALMTKHAKAEPRMWGPSIVGFGEYAYTYASGRSGTWPRVGFSPRKAALVVYLIDGYEGREAELAALGPHKIGKSCLYLKSLASVDVKVLEKMIKRSLAEMARRYPPGGA
jgi:hypothetical protein